jgi:hypothetical protein
MLTIADFGKLNDILRFKCIQVDILLYAFVVLIIGYLLFNWHHL